MCWFISFDRVCFTRAVRFSGWLAPGFRLVRFQDFWALKPTCAIQVYRSSPDPAEGPKQPRIRRSFPNLKIFTSKGVKVANLSPFMCFGISSRIAYFVLD